jgi:CHAT domain-containing protein/tetratricopeptide (TPR) repeat protein
VIFTGSGKITAMFWCGAAAMVERRRRLLVWQRWSFRLFCCFLAVLTSFLTLVTPIVGVVAQDRSRSPQPQLKPFNGNKPEPRVLIAEVVVRSGKEKLPVKFIDEVYRVTQTKPGNKINKARLQEDINAIFATGYFSNVKAIPEDTPLGVRVTFEVELNPIFQKVQVEGTTVLPEAVVAEAFSKQYGSVLNLVQLQVGIKKVNKWYQDKGYVLSQVIDAPKVTPDGIVTLAVAEGIIERIQIQFLKKDSDRKDAREFPARGRTSVKEILAKSTVKVGEVFDRTKVEAEIKRILGLNLVEDVRLALEPGQDPRKVVIVLKMINEYTALQRAAAAALDLQGQDNSISAVNQYKKVLELARSNHSKADEAFTLENIAHIYKENKNYRQAKDSYHQALEIFQGFNARLMELIIYISLGEVYRQLGEPDKALDAYQRAFQIQSSLKETSESFVLFGSLPKKYYFLTDKEELGPYRLVSYLQKPALLFDLATTYAAIGSYQQAFYVLDNAYPALTNSLTKLNEELSQLLHEQYKTFYEKFENEINQTFSRLSEILILLPYNLLYSSVGDPVEGRIYTEQAQKKTQALLDIWKHSINEKDTDKVTQSIKLALDFISFLLEEKKNDQEVAAQAQRLGESLSALMSETDDKSLQSLIPAVRPYVSLLLSSLGKLDNDEQSLLISDQVLKLLDASQNGSGKQPDWLNSSVPWIKSLMFDQQGAAYFRLRRYREALVAYRQAAEASGSRQNPAAQTTPSKNSATPSVSVSVSSDFASLLPFFQSAQSASRLLAVGKTYEALNEPENARASYDQFLKLPPTSRSTLGSAEANYGIAKAELLLGSAAKAKAGIETAIANSERPPTTLTGKSYGPGFASAEMKYGYGLKAEGGGNRGSIAASFVLSSATLDPYTATSDKPDPANPCSTISTYFACKQNYFEFYINLLLKQQQPDDTGAFEASERARTVTTDVFRASDTVPANQTSENPPNGKPTNSNRQPGRTRPAHLPEIQALLDDKTLLLEYFLGDKESYVWVVSKDSLKTYSLRGRATIEAKGREFYDLLTAPTGRVRPQTTAKVGKELSAMILGQIADQLGQKRLLVVGDGILQYIPFSTLPDPAATSDSNPDALKGEFAPSMQPLLVNHEVVNLLSASAMVELRQNKSSRPAPTKELAVFADPVFNYEDKRVNQTALARSKRQTHTILSQPGEPIYNALPGTKQEVEQISQFVAPEQRSQFLGFDANYETAISDTLKQYRRIHFATHGFFNIKAPEQSGIVLSAIRKNGELQQGSITPAATLKMDLSAADLVVLSGCRTGLSGDLIREGLTGLTGGLMAAGAERVVVSLWSVNDEATEKLMTLFYRNMYKNKLSPAQALRSAQLSLWQDERWQTPYNWAAFNLYGEWE